MKDHPEGVHEELTEADDRLWHLGVYAQCLDSLDFLNAALRASNDDLKYKRTNKNELRHGGLELLRDVDNCG